MTRRYVPALLCTMAAAALIGPGCTGKQASPAERSAEDLARDTDRAVRLDAEGARHLQAGRLDAAEAAFKNAVAADTMYGPAHNNLGAVYLRQKKYYQAAWEFQYAAKLLPHQAEPRNNLGLVYEEVGKLTEAAASYEEALELEPEAPEIIANLARVYVRSERDDARTRELLEQVVLRDRRPRWTAWAREQLATMRGRQ